MENNDKTELNAQNQPSCLGVVIPHLFFVVARNNEDNWEQITNGLDTYEEAKEYMNNSFCQKKYPYAFIVASINEV